MLSGLDSTAARAQESEAIVNWAFRQFSQRSMGDKGTLIAEAPVVLGAQGTVGMELENDLSVLVPVSGGSDVSAEVVYTGPLRAPITKGQRVGELVLSRGDLPEVRVPLVAKDSIAAGGFLVKLEAAARHLLTRLNEGPEAAS